jgi:hypothetical protein
MWQHHYVIHAMRMEDLRARADRERRWRRDDLSNGRATPPAPGPVRALAARGVAALSRGAARVARRLDARAAVEPGREQLLRDA